MIDVNFRYNRQDSDYVAISFDVVLADSKGNGALLGEKLTDALEAFSQNVVPGSDTFYDSKKHFPYIYSSLSFFLNPDIQLKSLYILYNIIFCCIRLDPFGSCISSTTSTTGTSTTTTTGTTTVTTTGTSTGTITCLLNNI